MTDAATEARARQLLANELEQPSCMHGARMVDVAEAVRAIVKALSTPTPAGELREVVRREVIEECAKVAEGYQNFSYVRAPLTYPLQPGSPYDRGKKDGVLDIAKMIRALAQPGSGEEV